jgi:hypothetical protein
VDTDVSLARVIDQTTRPQSVEQAGDHFAPRGDHLRELFLSDVVHDVRTLWGRLAKRVRENEQCAHEPHDCRLEGQALQSARKVPESFAQRGHQIASCARISLKLGEEILDEYLHDFAWLQRQGIFVSLADAEARLAQDVAGAMELKDHVVTRRRRSAGFYETAFEKEDAPGSLSGEVEVLSRRDVTGGARDKLIAQLTPQQSGDDATSFVLDVP